METGSIRIRRDYAPLTVSVAVACDSAWSPEMQVYDAATAEYVPDRQLSPTVLRPVISANAADGSWIHHSANSRLANVKWFANGVELSQAGWTERTGTTGDYSIEMSGSSRGSLTVYRNVTSGGQVSLHFEADLVDDRLGVTIHIKTDETVLSTVDKAGDGYGISAGEDPNIRYSPFIDKLLLYDYKVAHGIIAASSSAEAAAKDGNQYLRTIPITVMKGEAAVTEGYSLKLYKVTGAVTRREVTESDYEVVSVSASAVVLDLRLIEKADYVIAAEVEGTEVARIQISVQRMYPSFTCHPTNGTGIVPGQLERYDEVQVCSDGKIIECPGSVLRIVWRTDTANISGLEHNEGGTTVFSLAKTGVGEAYGNDWIDVSTEAAQKEAYSVAIDESGDILADEEGNVLIFN